MVSNQTLSLAITRSTFFSPGQSVPIARVFPLAGFLVDVAFPLPGFFGLVFTSFFLRADNKKYIMSSGYSGLLVIVNHLIFEGEGD